MLDIISVQTDMELEDIHNDAMNIMTCHESLKKLLTGYTLIYGLGLIAFLLIII